MCSFVLTLSATVTPPRFILFQEVIHRKGYSFVIEGMTWVGEDSEHKSGWWYSSNDTLIHESDLAACGDDRL